MVSELKNYIHDKSALQKEPYLGVIHRLDQPVEGILVFARTPLAAKALGKQFLDGKITKEYLAVVCGKAEPGIHTLVDYLKKDAKTNTSSVAGPGEKNAKRAELTYELCESEYRWKGGQIPKEEVHLVKIRLHTGRHHQIRVQMAHAHMPLLGDRKYGKYVEGCGGMKLCAYHLAFRHPATKKRMEFMITPADLQKCSDTQGEWKYKEN